MPKGDLLVQISDIRGEPVQNDVRIEFQPLSGDLGVGGQPMQLSVRMGSDIDCTVTGILCRGGPGTRYRVLMRTRNYRPYSFFQLIRETRINPAEDDVTFWVKPGSVSDIEAPRFDDLPARLRYILTNADMRAELPEDRDLLGASGKSLYDKLGPLRKACALNIAKKAADTATAENCFAYVGQLLVARQDRFFAMVDASLPGVLASSQRYKPVKNTLHKPLQGFQMSEHGSVKSHDAHANLQVTFMRNIATGELAADIDIDESAGIEHGLEVIHNAVFRKRTNPYLIREFMIAANRDHTLDPGYGFVFG